MPHVSLLADFIAHFHIQWLGFELSIPVPETPIDDASGDTFPPTIVAAMGEIFPATQNRLSFDRVIPSVICSPSVDVVLDITPMPRGRLSASIPLCDSARLERSGVLLA